MHSLTTIEELTVCFAQERSKLVDEVAELNAELERVKRAAMPRIRRALIRATDAQSNLINAIDASRHLFVQPRSVTIQGIKVGLQKAKDSIAWSDADAVARAVLAEMPEQLDTLIKTERTPIVAALMTLEDAMLKRLHCRRVDGQDEVLVKPTGSEIDKLLAKLTKELQGDATQDAEEAA